MEKKKYYIIYRITNLINKKIYIGKHSTNRLKDGYIGSGKLIQKAIKKYGRKCFKKDILFYCSSEEELNKKEAEIITEKFVSRNDTYNLKVGGKGGWNYIHENGLGISGAIKGGERFLELIKDEKYKIEWKEKVSKAVKKARKEKGTPWKGRKHTEDTKQKMSLARKGKGTGKKNSQSGTCWIYNLQLRKSIKILEEELQIFLKEGWLKGRKLKFF